MKLIYSFLLIALLALLPMADCLAGGEEQFIAIAYHDVVRTRTELASDAVTIDHLIGQFEWLLANRYHPISIDDLLAARAGEKPLPERAVLLCWDDGYASFYNLVFPLLKAYNFPAVLALEGSWIEPGPSATVRYGKTSVPRKHFLSWQQLRQLAASPLIEIASHSFNLHRGVVADRFGTRLPAAIAHIHDPVTGQYETDREQFERIYKDLQKNSLLIQSRLGVRPRVMVWPFGRYNQTALAAARKAGMAITLTLDPVPANINNLREIGRIYPTLNPDLADFRGYLDPYIRPPVRHFFKVDSRLLLDRSPDTENSFSLFLNRVKNLHPGMISFSPVIKQPEGLRALFPSTVLAMAQDRLGRLTWHTAHRGGTEVFLWLPSSLFRPDTFTRDKGRRFFAEMGRFSFCQGLLVDSPALANALFSLPAKIRPDGRALGAWNPVQRRMARRRLAKTKIGHRAAETLARLAALQKWQPFLEMGLVLPLERLPGLTRKRIAVLLGYVDFLLVDARSATPDQVYRTLQKNIPLLRDNTLSAKIYFLFQKKKSEAQLARLFASLPRYNIINWGYEYDDFQARRPEADTIRTFISNADDPFE